MSQSPASCPYCNAPVRGDHIASPGQWITCGLCGEAFVSGGSSDSLAHPTEIGKQPAFPSITIPTRRNRVVGTLVITMMALMAGLGMAYALFTSHLRRENDRRLVERPIRSFFPRAKMEELPIEQKPLQQAALAYLPSRINLLLGLQMQTLAGNAAGKELLNQPIRIGSMDWKPGHLSEILGLQPDGIDHLVLGVSTSDPLVPLGVLIVRTREACSAEHLQKKLKGELIPGVTRSNLFRVRFPDISFQPAVLWLDEHTLALAVIPGHLDQVKEKPNPDLVNLSDDLKQLLRDRIELGSTIWAVGEITSGTRNLLDGFSRRLNPEILQNVRGLQAFACGLGIGSEVHLSGFLKMESESAALKWKEKVSGSKSKVVVDGSSILFQISDEFTSLLKLLRHE